MNGYPIAAEALDLEVYVLAALFTGSQTLSTIGQDHPGLRWAQTTFESSEISRRLISLAVMLRNRIEGASRTPSAIVGFLMPDISKPTRHEKLALREACNKIIHAEVVDLTFRQELRSPTVPVPCTVTLEGTYNNMNWRVRLDTLAFLDAACEQF